MKYLLIFISLSVFAGEPLPDLLVTRIRVPSLPLPNSPRTTSTLHLERHTVDKNNGKTHESYETYDYSTAASVDGDLADLTAAIYFKDSHYPLREYIEASLRKKIATAKMTQEAGTKTSLQALEALMIQKHSLKSSIDLAHKDAQVATFVHRMVMEAIEDAFIEKDNELTLKEKSKKQVADALVEQRSISRLVAWGHIANSLVSAGITAGIILASIYGTKQ